MFFFHKTLFPNLAIVTLSLLNNDKAYIKQQPINKDHINISYIKAHDYIKINKYSSEFKIQKENILKKNGSITIILKNKKPTTFIDKKDKNDETSSIIYTYIGSISKLNMHIIQIKYYESDEYLMLNTETGKKYYCWSIPNISPTGKKIMCISGSINYDIMPNGIQIFDIEKNNIVKNIEYTTDKWEPIDAFWENDRKIMLKMIIPSNISLSKKDEIKYSAVTF